MPTPFSQPPGDHFATSHNLLELPPLSNIDRGEPRLSVPHLPSAEERVVWACEVRHVPTSYLDLVDVRLPNEPVVTCHSPVARAQLMFL
jgi:hypothetical protein